MVIMGWRHHLLADVPPPFSCPIIHIPVIKIFTFFFSLLLLCCRYKKTQETFSQAGQKTSAAISTVSDVVTRKLGDMR